jgi:hypothetical protein
MFPPIRRCSFARSALLRHGLLLVWRVVSPGSSLKASLIQSCGGIALRGAEAGGGLRGLARQRKGHRGAPRCDPGHLFDAGNAALAHRDAVAECAHTG